MAIKLKFKKAQPEKAERPGTFGGPWRVILSTLAIFLFSQLVAGFFVGFIEVILHRGSSGLDFFNNSIPAQFFYVMIAEGLAAGLVIWLVRRRGLNLSAIGLGRYPNFKDLKWAISGAIVFYAIALVGSLLLSLFVSQNQLDKSQDLGFNNLVSHIDWLMAFFALVIFPPIGEEILVRGYLYSGLRKAWRFIPAMLVTSLLFGLAHLNGGAGGSAVLAAAVDTFLLSVVLVFVREKSGALFAGMLIHSLNNLVAFLVHFK